MTAVVVNTVSDTATGNGVVTLSDAITTADSSSAPTTITFDPTVFATAQTIDLGGDPMTLSNTNEATTITGPAAGLTISAGGLTRAVFVDGGASLTMSGLTITDGYAQSNNGDGGAIYVSSGGNLVLTDVIVSDSTGVTGCSGGGIFNLGTATFTDITVTGNSDSFSTLVDGATYGQGGGIYNQGTMAIQGANIDDNTSEAGGGGIFNDGAISVQNTSIVSNTTTEYYGGGFNNNPDTITSDATASLTNVTIAGNSAQTLSGGGVCAIGGSSGATSSITLRDVTVYGNSANEDGGGIYLDSADSHANMGNTIVAGNAITGAGGGPDVSGVFASAGNNLIGKTNGSSGWVSADLTGTTASPLSAELGSLANNGGPTEMLLPVAGSPAIGAGSVALIPVGITTDQRGHPRTINGAVDIGAVEAGGTGASSSPPTAALTASTLKAVQKYYSFTVTYTSLYPIDIASLGVHNVFVTGPDDFAASASLVSFTSAKSGKTVTATYRVKSPASKWTAANNGKYHVYVRPDAVKNEAGIFVIGGILGPFKVLIA